MLHSSLQRIYAHLQRVNPLWLTASALLAIQTLPLQVTHAQDDATLAAILNANDRDIAHLLRDDSRHPEEVIQFLGITDGMRVLDIYAADGYYTFLASRIVGPDGIVYAQNPAAGSNVEDIRQMYSLADALDQRIELAALENVIHLREGLFDLSIAPGSLDLILLVQILHDFYNGDPAFATTLLTQLATYLKPGGIVGVIDHVGDAGQDNSRLHRMQKSDAIALGRSVGLRLIGDNETLANPGDRHRRPVFDPMLGRNTDRFLLKFQK